MLHRERLRKTEKQIFGASSFITTNLQKFALVYPHVMKACPVTQSADDRAKLSHHYPGCESKGLLLYCPSLQIMRLQEQTDTLAGY